MTIALDACVLIAHFDESDPHHEAAATLLSAASGHRLIAHPLTIAEVLVGSARLGRAVERRDSIRSMRIAAAASDEDAPLRLADLRAHTRHRMPDCCVLDVALRYRATLATFDDRLSTSAKALGIRTLPHSRS